MELPVYRLSIDLNDEESGVYAASLVTDPAIEQDWVAMSAAKVELTADADKMTLTGPLLIPGMPVYRNTEARGEHYIVADRGCVEACALKFAMRSQQGNSTHQHRVPLAGNTVYESWLTNGKSDKSVALGYDLPEGTWFITMKVSDRSYWESEVKTGKVKGFSLEGLFDHSYDGVAEIKKEEMSKEKTQAAKPAKKEKTLLARIREMLNGAPVELEAVEYVTVDGESVMFDESMTKDVVDAEGNVIGKITLTLDAEVAPATETTDPTDTAVATPAAVLTEKTEVAASAHAETPNEDVVALSAAVKALTEELAALKAAAVAPVKTELTTDASIRPAGIDLSAAVKRAAGRQA